MSALSTLLEYCQKCAVFVYKNYSFVRPVLGYIRIVYLCTNNANGSIETNLFIVNGNTCCVFEQPNDEIISYDCKMDNLILKV